MNHSYLIVNNENNENNELLYNGFKILVVMLLPKF